MEIGIPPKKKQIASLEKWPMKLRWYQITALTFSAYSILKSSFSTKCSPSSQFLDSLNSPKEMFASIYKFQFYQ